MFLSFSFFIFILGLCVGSFLNCLIFRLNRPDFSFFKDMGGLGNRSHCPHCSHPLNWLDLIPILSFLWLGGRCRYCRKKISWQYPLVEIATGVIFLFMLYVELRAFNQTGIFNTLRLVFLLYMASSLIVIFVYDLTHYLIPDGVLFPAIGVAFLYRLWPLFSLPQYVGAAIIAAGFFLALFLLSRGRWMGFGDVKLAVLLGLILGFPAIFLGLFLSFFFGAILGIILILAQKKGLKSEIPFAPFLILGTFVAMGWGGQIIGWYTHFLIF